MATEPAVGIPHSFPKAFSSGFHAGDGSHGGGEPCKAWAEAGDKSGNHTVKLSCGTEPGMGIRGLFTTGERKPMTSGWAKKPEQERDCFLQPALLHPPLGLHFTSCKACASRMSPWGLNPPKPGFWLGGSPTLPGPPVPIPTEPAAAPAPEPQPWLCSHSIIPQ